MCAGFGGAFCAIIPSPLAVARFPVAHVLECPGGRNPLGHCLLFITSILCVSPSRPFRPLPVKPFDVSSQEKPLLVQFQGKQVAASFVVSNRIRT
jgi:hypothetical protein